MAVAITDTYEYDAFGNPVTTSGSTPNTMLYRGEQFDPDLWLYYLRARYYNFVTGRFLSRDPEDGDYTNPATLHKYLYAHGDPVNAKDPTGRADTVETGFGEAVLFTAVVGTYYAARTNPTAVVGALQQLGREIDCDYEFLACSLSGLADYDGSVYGESRCQECQRTCQRIGYWPKYSPRKNSQVRCDYKNFGIIR